MNRIFTFFMLIVFTFSLSAQTTTTADTSIFTNGPNATWTSVFVAQTSADGNTGEAQSLVLNVTELPTGGASYRVYKTTANGSDYFGNATALTVGKNLINVAAVTFNRTVKVQFSSGDIAVSNIVLNGTTTLNVDEINSGSFTIYPNPVSDKISVIGIENINSVKVFNSLGALVKHSNSANDIDVSDLSKGIHFIQVDNGNIMTKKFIKK